PIRLDRVSRAVGGDHRPPADARPRPAKRLVRVARDLSRSGGAVIAFWVFLAHSLTASRPFLDPKLLLDRNFAIGLLIAFFMGMLSFTSLVLFPGLLHDLRGYPDSTIGMLLAARGTGNWVAFLVVVPFSTRYPRLAVATG